MLLDHFGRLRSRVEQYRLLHNRHAEHYKIASQRENERESLEIKALHRRRIAGIHSRKHQRTSANNIQNVASAHVTSAPPKRGKIAKQETSSPGELTEGSVDRKSDCVDGVMTNMVLPNGLLQTSGLQTNYHPSGRTGTVSQSLPPFTNVKQDGILPNLDSASVAHSVNQSNTAQSSSTSDFQYNSFLDYDLDDVMNTIAQHTSDPTCSVAAETEQISAALHHNQSQNTMLNAATYAAGHFSNSAAIQMPAQRVLPSMPQSTFSATYRQAELDKAVTTRCQPTVAYSQNSFHHSLASTVTSTTAHQPNYSVASQPAYSSNIASMYQSQVSSANNTMCQTQPRVGSGPASTCNSYVSSYPNAAYGYPSQASQVSQSWPHTTVTSANGHAVTNSSWSYATNLHQQQQPPMIPQYMQSQTREYAGSAAAAAAAMRCADYRNPATVGRYDHVPTTMSGSSANYAGYQQVDSDNKLFHAGFPANR